jgi:hypothetical protein
MKNIVGVLFLAALLLALTSLVHADTVASTLSQPGSTYSNAPPYALGSACKGGCELAVPFTVPAGSGFTLTQIDIAVVLADLAPTSAIIELLTNSGSLPGAIVPGGAWTITGLPLADSATSIQPSQTISGITGITLVGGTVYWLAAFPGVSTSRLGWALDTTGQTGNMAGSGDGGATWSPSTLGLTLGAFDVLGTPIVSTPEPPAILLSAAGLAGHCSYLNASASRGSAFNSISVCSGRF